MHPPIRVLASSISFAAALAPLLTHFAARPFPARTAALTLAREPCFPCQKECAVHGGRKNLGGAYGASSIAPQKRELDSPRVWRVSVARPARRASGGCCEQKQPTDSLKLKGFHQPLAAAVRCLKERQSPRKRPVSGAPLQVPVLGAGATDRTGTPRAHRPSGRERRPRKLHILRGGKSISGMQYRHSVRVSKFVQNSFSLF